MAQKECLGSRAQCHTRDINAMHIYSFQNVGLCGFFPLLYHVTNSCPVFCSPNNLFQHCCFPSFPESICVSDYISPNRLVEVFRMVFLFLLFSAHSSICFLLPVFACPPILISSMNFNTISFLFPDHV